MKSSHQDLTSVKTSWGGWGVGVGPYKPFQTIVDLPPKVIS